MKPIAAIVEPADGIAKHAAAVDQALVRLREAEQHAEQADRRAQSAHEATRARRLDLGRALIAARKCFPKASRNAKGWTDFLAVRRMTLEQAQDAMKYAGFVDETLAGASADAPANLPTMRKAGLDPRPRENEAPETEVTAAEVFAFAAKLAPEARGQLQRSLRSLQARENEGERDAYCSPDDVTAALPEVDLDPCSNPRSSVRARETYSLEAGQDGLALPWYGMIYVNFPFSDPLPWCEKIAEERPNLTGIGVMCNADHSPAWWHVLTPILTLRLDFNERLQFKAPPGVAPSKNDRPQSLLMDETFWAECDQSALLAMGTLWRQEPGQAAAKALDALVAEKSDSAQAQPALHIVR